MILFYSRLRHEQYNSLAAKIIILFPTESIGTYYVPVVKNCHSLSKKTIMAKGKLVNQVRNIIFLSGETVKRKAADSNDSPEDSIVPKKRLNLGNFLK